MARTLNMVQMIGRLGADPQAHYSVSGLALVTFTLATVRQWQEKDGTTHEELDWHRVVARDGLARLCLERLLEEQIIYVEGRLENSSWVQNGQPMYRSEIVASDVLILDSQSETRAIPELVPVGAISTAGATLAKEGSHPESLPY